MVNSEPFFSIIIPTYNRAGQISNAINSVLDQSFASFEIIIVDDGSTDETDKLMARFNDSRLTYYSRENKGVSQSRNDGAFMAKGKYLIFLDTDDSLSSLYLEKFHQKFLTGDYKIGFGYAKYIDPQGKQIAFVAPENTKGRFGPRLAGAFAISKLFFDEMKGYDPHLSYSENTEFFLRMELENKLDEDSICLVHDEGIIVTARDSRERFNSYSASKYRSTGYFLEKHKPYFSTFPDLFVIYKTMYAIGAFQNGDLREARRSILDVIIKKPLRIKPYLQFLLFTFPFLGRMYWKKYKE